jgi:type 1 fimbriae regulatory protein FimB/type 1 fimbriae regulatory protein FimE
MRNKAKTSAQETAPTTENGTVPPRRVRNGDRRPREYLTAKEVQQLMEAARARGGRYGHRDATLILLSYRHGLRAGGICCVG